MLAGHEFTGPVTVTAGYLLELALLDVPLLWAPGAVPIT
jgi:hypothetical protein